MAILAPTVSLWTLFDMIDIDRIRRAITVARSQGYTITTDTWCNPKERICCALGAVGVEMGLSDADLKRLNLENIIAKELGVSYTDTQAFIFGFDNLKAYSTHDMYSYNLGKQMRKECFPDV